MFVSFPWNKGLCLSVNVDNEKMASKEDAQANTLEKPTRNVQVEDPAPTYLLNKCGGVALSVQCSPMTELLWRPCTCSQNTPTPVQMSEIK